MPGGPDGSAITSHVNGHLDYVSQLAKQLGVNDPVDSYLMPAVGRWNDLHDEANRWRTAAKTAEEVTHRLTAPLGGLDAAWQGKDATSFLDYMQRVGLAGNDMSDAMNAMADALDKTADGVRQIVQEMVDLLTDTADQSSDAMSIPVSGESRAREFLEDLDEPTGKLHDAVKDVLAAFTKLCDGVHGGQSFDSVTMAHKMPAQNWAPSPRPAPAGPPPPTHTVPSAVTRPAPVVTPQHPVPPQHTAPASTPTPAGHPAPIAASHPSAHGIGGGGGPSPLVGHSSAGLTSHPSGPSAASGALVDDPTTGSISGQLPTSGTGAPGAGADAGGQQQQGASPMGMGGMGGMRGAQGGGDQVHKSKTRISGDVKDIFGKPDRTAPPTIGDR